MTQIFHPAANSIAKATLFGGILLVMGLFWFGVEFNWSPFLTEVGVPREQPIPFSHKHHVYDVGIDCRYCHTSVEDSSFAGIPPLATCMNCHSVIWKEAPVLEPLREKFKTNEPLEWVRVHDLPDFVYFNHSIHVQKGVGCVTCHGQVDQMPLMWRTNTLHMSWCLECHRAPEKYVRPKDQVFNMAWAPEESQEKTGRELVQQYHIAKKTNCTVCHR